MQLGTGVKQGFDKGSAFRQNMLTSIQEQQNVPLPKGPDEQGERRSVTVGSDTNSRSDGLGNQMRGRE
jgi:hypothetical protein